MRIIRETTNQITEGQEVFVAVCTQGIFNHAATYIQKATVMGVERTSPFWDEVKLKFSDGSEYSFNAECGEECGDLDALFTTAHEAMGHAIEFQEEYHPETPVEVRD